MPRRRVNKSSNPTIAPTEQVTTERSFAPSTPQASDSFLERLAAAEERDDARSSSSGSSHSEPQPSKRKERRMKRFVPPAFAPLKAPPAHSPTKVLLKQLDRQQRFATVNGATIAADAVPELMRNMHGMCRATRARIVNCDVYEWELP